MEEGLDRLNLRLPQKEKEKLLRYCQKSRRTYTTVIRDLIATLPEEEGEEEC